MTRRTDPRTRQLGRIHMLAKTLGLDDDTYRDVLWVQARVKSAKDLDEHGRRQVITHLESLLGASRKVEGNAPRNMDRPLMRKIRAQLAESGKSWMYAAGIAAKQSEKKNLDWCTDEELQRVVVALALQAKRDRAGRA